MRLLEFFEKLNFKNIDKDNASNIDDVFSFILNHDKLHKDFFIPIAKKIKKDFKEGKTSKKEYIKIFKPMVLKGCKEYYIKEKLNKKFENLFPEDFQLNICEKLCDHFYDDIVREKYKVN